VVIILSPLILIALLVLWPFGWAEWALRVLAAAGGIFCSMRGLEVNLKKQDQYVHITVI
jgi:hypothetical protein